MVLFSQPWLLLPNQQARNSLGDAESLRPWGSVRQEQKDAT